MASIPTVVLRLRPTMLIATTWKVRPIQPEAAQRMMAAWGKLEADMAETPGIERLRWYAYNDGSGGFAVDRADDEEAVHCFGLELSLTLGELPELESRLVMDLESALPAITAAMERIAS